MATIVTHKSKGGRFVLLGASQSVWKTAHGSAVFGNLAPVKEEGAVRALAFCGADGVIQFGDADQFAVLSIDGQSPAELLRE